MPSIKIRRYARYDDGAANVLEAIAAIGISIAILALFFFSANNLYNIYDRPEIDLKAKSIGILEQLLNSPGKIGPYGLIWENDPLNVSTIGLSTSPTVAYGVVYLSKKGESTVLSRYDSQGDIGFETCFLEGTKILMADGSYKNIEDIKIGDLIKSYSKENKFVTSKVTNIFQHSPEEMTDYYLIINNQLRVTPNHKFYSNQRWVYASDLKIGDTLFSPTENIYIYSLEKIYERATTYDLEVDVHHNYFVKMNNIDILVHNSDIIYYDEDYNEDPGVTEEGGTMHSIPAGYEPPTATFVWFDEDGLKEEKKIIFDATASIGCGLGGNLHYSWWFNLGGTSSDPDTPDAGPHPNKAVTSKTYDDNNPYVVKLRVNDTYGWCNYTCTVQANTINVPNTEPETETIEIYPKIDDKTFAPYDERYYVRYTPLGKGYYIYEIKSKINPTSRAILDLEKIENLPPGGEGYWRIKSCLGLDRPEYIGYNYYIKVTNATTKYEYGVTWEEENFSAAASATREVLIYHSPIFNNQNGVYTLTKPPSYEFGRITVTVLRGGEVPNSSPNVPSNPYPAQNANDVCWDVSLSWECSDRDYDSLKYDVYFGTANPPTNKVSANQSSKSYDPLGIDMMNENTKYYWKIVAWDDDDANTSSPVWWFTTHKNNKPNAPSNPNPDNLAEDVCVVDTTLSWTCEDIDNSVCNDPLKYDVYFGKTNPPPLIVSNSQFNTYSPFASELGAGQGRLARLDYNTTYYWKIVTKDSFGATETSQIWRFTTAKKGLDQTHNTGAGNGLTTRSQSLGQTFTAGRTGNLTSIDLSLRNSDSGGQPKKILVRIRNSPEDEEILACGNITGFSGDLSDAGFSWKTANLDNPIIVNQDQPYFIEIVKTETNYEWQYSGGTGSAQGGGDYPLGEAFKYDGATWQSAFPPASDFLFKTYVLDPIIDQECQDKSNSGVPIGSGLAQTFVPSDIVGENADLIKVNLSLKSDGMSNIVVKIYEGIPSDSAGGSHGDNPKATTTINAFNSNGLFVWKEAKFTNVPYLSQRKSYYIEISKVLAQGSCEWETSNRDYSYGEAWQMALEWRIIEPETDFIFITYMDTIDTCRS